MIIVTAAIIQEKAKILIARRASRKHLGGYWELPGGKLIEGESEEFCLEREIREEMGIKIEVGDFFMQNKHEYENVTILLKAYICKFIEGEVQLNDHDSVEWVDITALSQYRFAPADVPIIDALINR